MNRLLAYILMTFSMDLFAVVKPDYYRNVTRQFNRIEKFNTNSRPDRIVYGNSKIGYFATKDFVWRKGKLKVRFIPPSYRHPIEFFAARAKGGRLSKLGRKSYTSPLPNSFGGVSIRVRGQFSDNFFLISGSLPVSSLRSPDRQVISPDLPMRNKSRYTFAAIVNRLGEIVWTYVPFSGEGHFNSYIYGKPLGKGRIAFILGKKDGFYTEVDVRGVTLRSLNTRVRKNSFPIHHDFSLTGDGRLLTISNRYLNWKGKSYLTNDLVSVDLVTGKLLSRVNLLDFFHPDSVKHWVENKEKQRFVSWNSPAAEHDFFHANAIEKVEDYGYLVSLKHLDKLVMFGPNLKKIRWTIGRTLKDTYRTSGDAIFSHQHSPQMLDDDSILLFDNGFSKQRSRLLELELDKKSRTAKVAWSYSPKQRIYSKNRSSVVRLKNRNLLAFYVDPIVAGVKRDENRRTDIMREVSYPKAKTVAEMSLTYFTASPGYRSVPLSSIGVERYVGTSPGKGL